MVGGRDIAVCPSCSLMIEVIFEPEDLVQYFKEAGVVPPEVIAAAA